MIRKYIVLSFLGLLTSQSYGQIEDAGTELFKPFQAKLAESKKYEADPILPKLSEDQSKDVKYTVPTHLMAVDYPPPTIRPLAMRVDRLPPSYSFYAKAGIGFPLSPILEASYHNKDIKNLKYGITAKHYSINGQRENQNFGETSVDAGLTYFTEKNLAIGGNLGFDLNANRFYGYLSDSLTETTADSLGLNADSLRQRFINIEANVGLFNHNVSRNNLNYAANLGFYTYSDRYQASEFSITPEATIEKWFGKRQLNPFRAKIGANIVSFNQDTASRTRALLYVQPNFSFTAGDFKGRLGADFGLSDGGFYILPDVEFSFSIAKGAFVPYVGAVGQIKQNTFRSLTRYNPFLISNPTGLLHTRNMDIFGGLRGNIRNINYDIQAGYALTQNLPIFLNDTLSDFRRFRVDFDTANVIFVRGSLDFGLIENLHLGGTMSYYLYNTRFYERAFHLPTLETNIYLTYDLYLGKSGRGRSKRTDKEKHHLAFRAEFFVNSGIPYLDETGTRGILNGLFDFNLGLTYHVNKNFGLFLNANNLINNQNQRWYRYPQIGFNIQGGAVVKF